MSEAGTAIVGLAITTFAIRAAGPVVLGGRSVPDRVARAFAVLPAAMLTALVVAQTAVRPGAIALDARAVGVCAAAVASVRGASMVAAVAAGAFATAAVRLIGLG